MLALGLDDYPQVSIPVFLKLFQTKDHLANKKKTRGPSNWIVYPRNNRPSTQTWHQTIVSGTWFSRVGTPFLHTGRLVIDDALGKASGTLLHAWLGYVTNYSSLTASYSHHTLRHANVSKHNDAHADRSNSLPTVGQSSGINTAILVVNFS